MQTHPNTYRKLQVDRHRIGTAIYAGGIDGDLREQRGRLMLYVECVWRVDTHPTCLADKYLASWIRPWSRPL